VCTLSTDGSVSTSLIVSNSNALNVLGSLTLLPTSTVHGEVSSQTTAPLLAVSGSLDVTGSTLVLVVGPGVHNVLVAQAGQLSGQLSNFTVVSSDPCTSVTSSQLVQSSSSLSVTVQTSDTCGSSLSAGAIAGIVVGCALVAALLVLALVLFHRHRTRLRDAQANTDLRGLELSELKRTSGQ
jgi:hypothetical protein